MTTSLDLDLNKLAEQAISEHAGRLARQNANYAALVAVDPRTGQILAMVGSRDFFDRTISGEVNMATAPRQVGSTIKPLTYALAFTKGWGPHTVIVDGATSFPNPGGGPPYRPQNFDRKFDGPMTIRYALANSKNLPAVKALAFVTVPELQKFAGEVGVRFERAEGATLSLGLGAGAASLLSMAGAYAAFDNLGLYHPPEPILRVEDWQGRVLERYEPSRGKQAVPAEQAYMVTSILADNWARTPLQGPDSPLKLSRPAAAKTGSTDDYRDSWLIGYTPDLVTGVWVGNTDSKPMREVVGSLGAGRIWHGFIEAALEGKPVVEFTPPPGVKEYKVCRETGRAPTPDCRTVITEVWPADYRPSREDCRVGQFRGASHVILREASADRRISSCRRCTQFLWGPGLPAAKTGQQSPGAGAVQRSAGRSAPPPGPLAGRRGGRSRPRPTHKGIGPRRAIHEETLRLGLSITSTMSLPVSGGLPPPGLAQGDMAGGVTARSGAWALTGVDCCRKH